MTGDREAIMKTLNTRGNVKDDVNLFFVLLGDCWGGRVEDGEVFVERGNRRQVLRLVVFTGEIIHTRNQT